MDFKVLGLEHVELLRPYFVKNLCRICDCTIGGTFIWRDLFKTEFSITDEILYLKVKYLTGDVAFTPPRGEPCAGEETYDRIIDYCREIGCVPRLCAVSPHRLERIKALYPDAKAYTDRAWSDYLYLSDDIVNLPGGNTADSATISTNSCGNTRTGFLRPSMIRTLSKSGAFLKVT